MKITLYTYKSALKIWKKSHPDIPLDNTYGLPERIFDKTYKVNNTKVYHDKCPVPSSVFETEGWFIPGTFVSYIKY